MSARGTTLPLANGWLREFFCGGGRWGGGDPRATPQCKRKGRGARSLHGAMGDQAAIAGWTYF